MEAIEESEDILWLYGSAGAGKIAIAQTIAENYANWTTSLPVFPFPEHLNHEITRNA